MDKRFALVVRYECGSCVFLTNTFDLEKALAEFREVQEKRFASNLKYKSFSLPTVISAELLNVTL